MFPLLRVMMCRLLHKTLALRFEGCENTYILRVDWSLFVDEVYVYDYVALKTVNGEVIFIRYVYTILMFLSHQLLHQIRV